MTKELQKIFKNFGWSVHQVNGCYENEKCYELENWSPAGENLIVVIYGNTDAELILDFIDYYENFDPEVHALEMVNVPGAPGISVLLDDAEEIDEMLFTLKIKLEKFRREEL